MTSSGSAHRPTVVVVGAINVDFVVVAPRLPAPGETVVGDGMRTYGGGKGANAAVAAARAGAQVVLVGAVGADPTGTTALEELRADGVDVAHVAVLSDQPTGVALIVVDAGGENQIAVGGGANAALGAEFVHAQLRVLLDRADCVLVSTEIPADAVAAAVRAAVAAGVRCVLNPAPVQTGLGEVLGLGALLTPNETELRDLAALLDVGAAGTAISDMAITDMAMAVAARTGAPLIVTQGAHGVLVVDAGIATPVPSHQVTVVDTTGAGDTFNGVLATCLAEGASVGDAARTAVVAAALSVTVVGARGGMPSRATIDAFSSD